MRSFGINKNARHLDPIFEIFRNEGVSNFLWFKS